MNTHYARVTSQTDNQSVSAVLLRDDGSGRLVDAERITITNRWADLTLAVNQHVFITAIHCDWTIIAAECP